MRLSSRGCGWDQRSLRPPQERPAVKSPLASRRIKLKGQRPIRRSARQATYEHPQNKTAKKSLFLAVRRRERGADDSPERGGVHDRIDSDPVCAKAKPRNPLFFEKLHGECLAAEATLEQRVGLHSHEPRDLANCSRSNLIDVVREGVDELVAAPESDEGLGDFNKPRHGYSLPF